MVDGLTSVREAEFDHWHQNNNQNGIKVSVRDSAAGNLRLTLSLN